MLGMCCRDFALFLCVLTLPMRNASPSNIAIQCQCASSEHNNQALAEASDTCHRQHRQHRCTCNSLCCREGVFGMLEKRPR